MSIQEQVERVAAKGESSRRLARDPVNPAMVNNWLEALGDTNPRYVERGEAPPAMAQVWTMGGLHYERAEDDPLGAMMAIMDEAGFTSVVATNSEQNYYRYVEYGEHFSATTKLEDVVGPKRTALGEGWFITTKTTWRVGDEVVADMLFRVLKFKPAPKPSTEGTLRPVISRDTEFFWEGTKAGELRIQSWDGKLRHPPGPMPPDLDTDAKPGYIVAGGRGKVYSYIVHHRPAVPGKRLPFVIALVELEEGVRMLGEVADVSSVHIGQEVRAAFVKIDEDLTLPVWQVVS
ncbi:bifunctional MaoC family dehydratase N-terminal/OB-fold nucleic acid binding domain-containing protein [Amycolatopsis sp.]|uniref:bifunctional MaoC family dehydratase N-terminal/OB-fold nucleic acid binding domain-containing protein n=1 Tax=Amycolatopsis sp. TaxID=37632 RepID=UPI002BED90C1|nr:OB-fold domain-containing protein [Amycolatopsis sp.]HVV10133.1 OB-fold domain-containing protein [Amycolatopsis sp.]